MLFIFSLFLSNAESGLNFGVVTGSKAILNPSAPLVAIAIQLGPLWYHCVKKLADGLFPFTRLNEEYN